MPWSLETTRSAEKDMARLPMRVREAVDRVPTRLVADPGSTDLVKLSGGESRWRLRVGQWRVILRFDNAAGIIYVVHVLPRGRAYRD